MDFSDACRARTMVLRDPNVHLSVDSSRHHHGAAQMTCTFMNAAPSARPVVTERLADLVWSRSCREKKRELVVREIPPPRLRGALHADRRCYAG